jgi:MFS family permease
MESIREGFSYIRRSQVVMGLMMVGFVVVIFGMSYQTVLPVFARDILDAGELDLGLLGAAGGVGAVVGSLAIAAFSGPHQMRMFLGAGMLGLGMFIALFGLSPFFPFSLSLALMAGFFLQLAVTSNFALLQVVIPDHLRGRVLSIRFIIFGLSPAGTLSLGVAAEAFGTPLATAGMGILCLLSGALVLLLFPSLRRTASAPAEVKSRF